MALRDSLRRVIPPALGLAMLGVVIGAALTPNTGAVAVQAACQYNNCPTQTANLTYLYIGIAAVVVAAILAALLILRRRRRGPAEEMAGRGAPPEEPVPAYEEPPAGAVGPEMDYMEAPYPSETGEPAVPAPAVEPPSTPSGDIDSLMDELDKISGEILKKGAPKKDASAPPPDDAEQG